MKEVGRRLDEYEAKIRRLQADLANAVNEKSELVDALRSLHDQFHSLQQHADHQCDVLMSEGEELRATKQHIASLQKELASTRAAFEQAQSGAAGAATEDGYRQAEANYRDALNGMEGELKKHQAAVANRDKDIAELAERIVSLEQRCAELSGRRNEKKIDFTGLQKTLADREKQIERMNRYLVHMQRELKVLNADIDDSAAEGARRERQRAEPVSNAVASGKAQRKQNKQSNHAVTQLIPAALRKPAAENPQDAGTATGDDAPQQFVIVPVGDEAAGMQYPLNRKKLTIGRGRDNDIRVREKCISRVHARIVQANNRVFIEDLGSTNGLKVNSARGKRHELKHGDKFKIGHTEFELVDLAIRASGLRSEGAA